MAATSWPAALLLLVWLAFLGGCLGSFLNVLVYRWPRGMSVVWPGSRCPACRQSIRWYDNLPVLGWLRLRGRCRDCRAPISPRYPLVEAAAALALVGLGAHNLLSAPSPPTRLCETAHRVASRLGIGEEWGGSGWVFLAGHVLLVLGLAQGALVERDGLRQSWIVPLGLTVLGLVVPLAGHWSLGCESLAGAWHTGLRGALAGAALGAVCWLAAAGGPAGAYGQRLAILQLAAVGAWLDWPAALVTAALANGLSWALHGTGRLWPACGAWGWSAGLTLATWATIVAWPLWFALVRPLRPDVDRVPLAMWVLGVWTLALGAWRSRAKGAASHPAGGGRLP
jgi:prepilin signal peptidase PulO-like enzyme (type II secretory pathway)